MIRLLRMIRHRLLEDSSYGMYMLYAAGKVLRVKKIKQDDSSAHHIKKRQIWNWNHGEKGEARRAHRTLFWAGE